MQSLQYLQYYVRVSQRNCKWRLLIILYASFLELHVSKETYHSLRTLEI
jgi:hypothetical protein